MIMTITEQDGTAKIVLLEKLGNTFIDPLGPDLVLDTDLLSILNYDKKAHGKAGVNLYFSSSDPGLTDSTFVDYDAANDNFVINGSPLHVVNKEGQLMVPHRFYALLIPNTPQWVFFG